MLWWIDLHFTALLIDYTMYNYIGYAVDWSPQCCHIDIDCRIIVTTSVSSLHQTALPTRPSYRHVCTICNSVHPSFVKGTPSPQNRGRGCEEWHKLPPVLRYLWLSKLPSISLQIIQLIRLCRTVWVTDWQQPSQTSPHSSKVHCCHKTEGATEKNGTNDDHQYSMDTYPVCWGKW
jgi:hypothetical protein